MKAGIKTKNNVTTKMRTKLVFILSFVILAGLIGTALFIYFNFGNSENSFAAGSTYSSSGTGNWTTNGTWVGGTAPATTNINGDDITINSNHVVSSGSLDVLNNATFTISSNGTLKITGDLIVQNNLILNVSGLLIITGNLQTKNGGSITINGGGTTKISGSASFNNNTTLTVNGSLQVGSTISFGSSSTFTGSGIVKLGSGSGCSGWTGSGSCGLGTLPVKLLSFMAEETEGNVKISWKTAVEENNDFFTLQRTADGKVYTTIATVKGAGTSKVTRNYEYEDKSPLEGRSYYRLSQTDYDGKSETFPPVTLDILYGSKHSATFSLFPNPLTGNALNISFSKPEEGSIEIIDGKGNKVLTQTVDGVESQMQVTLSESTQPGVYIVRYKTATTSKTERLIKR